ncbi:kekkon 4 isoform 1-T11 [Cochliomyia hominivorax]
MKNKSNKIQFKQQQQQQQRHHQQHQPQLQQKTITKQFESIRRKRKRKFPIKEQQHQQEQQQIWRLFVKRKQQQQQLEEAQRQVHSKELFRFVKFFQFLKSNSTLLLLGQLILFTFLCNMPTQATADWLMDCGDCHCKWNSGKKTADCKNLTLTAVPENLSNEVQVLDLSLNRIVYLEENSFLNADLTNLHKLYIRNSTLQHIDPRSFTQLEILIELDLSNNMLHTLQANLFARLVKVRAIILNGNQLVSLGDGIFQNLKYLHKIELKDNRLVKIATQVFVNVPLLSQIYLNNNRLSFLRKESFESVKRLTALSLDGNPWNCTCELQIFRDFVLRRNLYTPPTACYYPSSLRGMLWIEDQPEAFACKPRIIFPAKGASINTSKENVTLVCRVHASANTHITWDYGTKSMYKASTSQLAPPPAQQLQQRIHIQIIQDDMSKEKDFGRNVYISRLTITGAEKSDEGTYTCVAENAGGKDSVQMTLLIQKAGARDMLQGNLAAVISLMALGLLSVSVFLAMVTCCIYKRFIASASAHQHRHHHLDLSGNDPLTAHGTVVANHGTTTVTGNTDVMLGVVDDTLKYKKHHHHLQQTTINGGTTLIKDKYSELIKHNGGSGMGIVGGGGGGDSIGSGNSPLMEQDGNNGSGGNGGSGIMGGKINCDVQLGHMEKKYYEQSNDDMLHIKYPHGRAQAEVNTVAVMATGQHIKGRNSNNLSGTTVEFQPDLLPAYAGNKINNKQQGDQLYSPVITPGSTGTAATVSNKTINMMEDQHLVTANATLPHNTTTSRSKYNTSAQEYLQARFGTITKKQTKSQEKLNTLKREAPLATGTSSLTVTRSSPNPADTLQQNASRQTKSLFLPQRTVCSATTTVTPTDSSSSYEYRQPPPPPYNATHRTAGNLLLTRRTSLNQHDSNEDNNKNSNTKDQGYRELMGGSNAIGIPLYETARQTIVTASPSMNFPTTITGYNTNTASPRRQLL